MAPDLHLHPLHADVTVAVESGPLAVPAGLEPAVDTVWDREQARKGGALFNGRTLSLLSHTPGVLRAQVVEYRLVLARRRRPDLFAALAIRPLAVSGLLRCADGVVFGRRGLSVTADAGIWELVPSGGLDAPDGAVCSPRDQILKELREEVGIEPSAVRRCRPFCLIEDRATGIFDIGVAIDTDLDAGTLRTAHEAASDEYSELRIVPDAAVADFFAGVEILPVSRLLHAYASGCAI